jgi:demethylmenaquinone methyltransferase / 2-methoxy-6-polyprenyl-1,4-benzoquinol methylase
MAGSSTTHFGFTDIPFADKVGRVREVFDSVADKYDLMNDLMSVGVHRLWKQYAIRRLRINPGDRILDVAGGTGDLARLMHKRLDGEGDVTIYDINGSMLNRGREKLTDLGMVGGIEYVQGNAEELPFPDNSFHTVTIGFGIRNVTQIDVAIKEMVRVLRPGGQFLCLEFSKLAVPALQPIYDTYSFKILPEIGHYVTQDRDSYQYLVESIRRFPNQESFKTMLEDGGLHGVRYHNLSLGVAAIHFGRKV